MHNRFIGSMMVVVAALVFSPGVFAQTYGSLGDAPGAWKPDQLPPELSKPKPFDPHDLSAVWAAPTLRDDVHWLGEHGGQDQDAAGPDILDKRPPFTPFGLEVVETHFPGSNGDKDAWSLRGRARINGYDNSPVSICDPLGFPLTMWQANERPFEFIQVPDRMLMHVQYHELWRTIWTDGRDLPKNPDPAWNGYAVGKWEGDTFVVKSTGYDDRTWFDRIGDPRSSTGVLEERWHRVDLDTLVLVMTLNDPKMYMKPWVGDPIIFKRQKFALYQEICAPSEEGEFNQNQRDAAQK
ncbi:MAG: hypothetical protein WCA19_11630 [Candidatus Acidiferrales bacterium]